jgi:carbon storage regulator
MPDRTRLIVTRKLGESIEIGDDVTVTVNGLADGGKVSLAVEAPRDVRVVRVEREST